MVEGADRLSDDDARILALESEVLTGHTLKLIILSPGKPLDLEALRASVLARLAAQPRSTERIATDGGAPRWVPAPNFDISQHVRRRAGVECATRADLRRVVSTLMSEHLDRERPLWTLDLIGPLADGSEAIAARMHHAMVDGIAAMRFLEAVLLDPHDAPMHDAGIRPVNGAGAGAGAGAFVSAGDAPAESAAPTASTSRAGSLESGRAEAAASPRPGSRREEWRRMPAAVVRELGRPGSPSPFDKPITIARELAFVDAPLDELKSIGSSRPNHATVNDVLLAIVAGGLHTWLQSHGSRLDLRAQVPVSLHHRDETVTELGNRDSFINVDLSLGEPDPLLRLDRISAQTRTEKQLDDAALMYDLFHALGRLNRAAELAERIAGSAREFSVAISNVPGPRIPVSVAGRRVAQLFTSAEPATHHALRISAISHADEIGIGFCTDPTVLPHIGALAEAVGVSYLELRQAASGER
jgi:diacylglycerol O-acyltransferase